MYKEIGKYIYIVKINMNYFVREILLIIYMMKSEKRVKNKILPFN